MAGQKCADETCRKVILGPIRRGLCGACYERHRNHGTLHLHSLDKTRPKRPQHECVKCEQTSTNQGRGLCPKCHQYERRHGTLENWARAVDVAHEEYVELRDLGWTRDAVQRKLELSDDVVARLEEQRAA